MDSAWATRQRIVLDQALVDDKSNEIVAIPLLLERLELKGALINHRHHRDPNRYRGKIVGRTGDYLLALKANRSVLHRDVVAVFDESASRYAGAHAYD